MIDANEVSDPNSRAMLDRILGRIGKEARFPMSISEITQGYDAYYRSGNSASGGAPSRPYLPQGGTSSASGLTSPPGMGFGTPVATSLGSFSSGRPAGLSPFGSSGISSMNSGYALQGSASSSTADPKSTPRKPAHFTTSRERLPKGLPDWFLKADVNGEGQVTMAEFASDWTPDKLREFNRYDLNGDGIITAAECLKVEKTSASAK
jgi:hypothetical protein